MKGKRMFPTPAEPHFNKCKHFNGVVNECCEAGIRYAEVRDSTTSPYRFPCFRNEKATSGPELPCPKREFPTWEEAQADEAMIEAQIAEYLAEIDKSVCPHCKRAVERKQQVGRCVYAEPCGHRLYQGRVANPR
jgi:hypothetical protein